MKKNCFKAMALVAMLLSPLAIAAQVPDGITGATQQVEQSPTPRHHHHGPRLSVDSLNTIMKAKLSLTTEQEEKVKALNTKYSDIIEGPARPPKDGFQAPEGNATCCSGKDTANCKGHRGQFEARKQEYDNELRAILSDNQYSEYEKLKSQFAGRRRVGKGRRDNK